MHRPFACLGVVALLLAACSVQSSPTDEQHQEQNATVTSASSVPVLGLTRITSKVGDPAYQHARADVQLPSQRNARVMLVVDLTTTCFPFSNWQLEPPPPGQRWPASCDAFDRNFEVALFDPQNPQATAIELVHAATPFGGPLHIEQDITDVANALVGATRTVDIFISSAADANGLVSGSNGGWNVEARLDVMAGTPERDVIAVIPIERGVVREPNKTYEFTLPEGTKSVRFEYTTTGHGSGPADAACIGPAEEFCHRKHTLTVDGAALGTVDPWRTDCATLCTMTDGGPGGRRYCKENPQGSPASVRASRANWCPGSVTPSQFFTVPPTPGAHVLGLGIDRVAERGNWRVSAKAFAYR